MTDIAENTAKAKPAKSPHYHGHRARMRGRLLEKGADSLADYELLELLLYAAAPRGDTKPLAKALIEKCGSFAQVLRAEKAELLQVEGCGEAAVATIKATHAASELLLKETAYQRPVIASWDSLLDYCRIAMGHEKIEQFRILFLDHKHNLILDEVQQTGTVNHTPVYPREVAKRALEVGASAIILAHNHPSGDPTPSKADIQMTEKIIAATHALSITVHDHLILAGKKYFSFKSGGLI